MTALSLPVAPVAQAQHATDSLGGGEGGRLTAERGSFAQGCAPFLCSDIALDQPVAHGCAYEQPAGQRARVAKQTRAHGGGRVKHVGGFVVPGEGRGGSQEQGRLRWRRGSCIHLEEPVAVGTCEKGQKTRQGCGSSPRSFRFRHENCGG